MRRFVIAACVAGLAIALSSGTAASAWASKTIVVGPGQSIQAAVNAASPGDTVLIEPGVYHQSVQIRTDGITLRGSGAFPGGTVLVPPKSFPKTVCNGAFGPTGVCILAKNVNPKTGAVITPVRDDKVTGLLVTGFPGLGYLRNRSRSAVYMTEPAGQATIRPCRADYGGRALTCAAPFT